MYIFNEYVVYVVYSIVCDLKQCSLDYYKDYTVTGSRTLIYYIKGRFFVVFFLQ